MEFYYTVQCYLHQCIPKYRSIAAENAANPAQPSIPGLSPAGEYKYKQRTNLLKLQVQNVI